MSDLVIIYYEAKGGGWAPIHHMVRLAADRLDATLITPPLKPPSFLGKLFQKLPRRRNADKPNCLLIAKTPIDLELLTRIDGWRTAFNQVAVWIIDAFYTQHLPRDGVPHYYDRVFLGYRNDLDHYRTLTKAPVSYLGWGADVLNLGGDDVQKDIDLLRIGRQPASWEDDADNKALFEAKGLFYQGRPPKSAAMKNHYQNAYDNYKRAKFVLAHSNLADGSTYTHQDKEYLTGRWMDALACGGVVIGVQPTSDMAMQELLWPEATVNLSTADRDATLDEVAAAIAAWTPERAAHNYRMALARLDWRWRFREIADALGVQSDKLDRDLEAIADKAGAPGA